MLKADCTNTTGAPGDDPGRHLANQAAASVETIQTLQRLRREARDEIGRLICFLDQSDPYVMTELEDDDDREEVGDSEPSLGSFDRMTNQEKAWRPMGAADVDAELDTSDDEPTLGSLDHYHSQELWAAGGRRDLEQDGAESGIGDMDGLDEQVPFRDWQNVGMV